MLDFIILLLKSVLIQIIGVLGIFFLFGFILSKLQEWTHQNYRRSIGWQGILWTAWFGTPIHEWGHVFFAKIFRHKIHKIALFKPNRETGGLGYTEHSYNPRSFYQAAGNFFVGAAPMIWGSLILFIMLYFLLPNGKEVFTALSQTDGTVTGTLESIKNSLLLLFTTANLKTWTFWLFLYLSFCLASHVAPSRLDRKQMWQGFFMIIIVLVVINIIALAMKIDITQYILKLNQYLGSLATIFTYVTLISLLHLILSAIILRPFRK